MRKVEVGYVNVFVSDLERSLAFFTETLGLELQRDDSGFGYAALSAGAVRVGLAQVDSSDPEQAALLGRHTGIGLCVRDLRAAHEELSAQGVAFPMPPERQPWGGFMALLEDPDGNRFYLDEAASPHETP